MPALSGLLSYAGVSLPIPNQDVIDWVANNIPLDENIVFCYRGWPGKNLTGLTVPTGYYPMKQVQLNKLFWYTGAVRFPYGHFLCDAVSLKQIQDQTNGDDCTNFSAQPLQMADSAGGVITPNMYMIRSQPLSGIRGVNGMFVITLVAKSYLWQSISCPDFAIVEDTTWDDLYAAIQTKIGQTISRDVVSDNYLQPSPTLNLPYENLPMVFDAVAWNCGQRVTLGLDGKIRVLNFNSSMTALTSNLSPTPNNLLRRAGDTALLTTL